MRSTSCNCAPARGWMEALLSSPGSVGHEIRPRASSERTTPLPVRSLIANKSFVKGERVAVVPENMILTGAQASSILQHWGPTYAATLSTTTAPTAWMNHFHAVCRALPPATQLVESRDAFLITSALFLMRWVQEDEGRQLPKPGQDPICAWAASLPAKMPPMGAVLEEQLHHQRVCFTPLHKQIRLGSETVVIGDGSVAEAQTELMISAVEKGVMDVAALTTPTTEVEVSPTMRQGFYNGKRTAMTQRQHEAQVAQRERPQADAARRHYLALEGSLHRRCLAPLAAALRGRSSDALKMDDDDDDDDGGGGADDATWSRLCWAHFMMRSRAVNIHWRSGTSSPAVAVVPFLDQLNHGDASQPANITYRWMAGQQHGTGSVFITASRPIRRGEELVLHYGHRGQRGCLFGASSSPSSSSPTLSERIATELKRVEDRQRLELDHRRTSHAVEEGEMNYNAPTNGADSDVVAAEREAAWLWRFGFARNEAERSFEASARWSAGLRGRIAHLTDARRKGRPGEFVVGVPEGLEHLRRQRERLERERYGSTHVFPPTRV